jgi:hypothetical protein
LAIERRLVEVELWIDENVVNYRVDLLIGGNKERCLGGFGDSVVKLEGEEKIDLAIHSSLNARQSKDPSVQSS